MKINNGVAIFALIIVFVLSLAANAFVLRGGKMEKFFEGAIPTVSAEEIYPMFVCPCCGQPLDKKNICCGQAQERIDYIDSMVVENLSEKEIILDYIKKFGLNSFANKNKQIEFKNELAKAAPQDRPIINIAPDSVDLGDVSQKKGITTTFFEIKNTGKKELVVNKLDTSCGCTSASVVFNGEEGPKFAMAGHGTENPTNWQITIAPEETAQLKIYYDPNVHKDLKGPVTREIYVYSNDPVEFEKKVQIELNQTD